MRDERKTKKQLVRELRTLRAKQKKLEKSTEKLRQAEEQRRQAKDQYQQLVENINEVIFSLDDGGIITYVSPAISVIAGYIPSELRGRPFSDFVLPEDLTIANSGFQRTIRGELGPSEFRMPTKSGHVRWFRSSSRPIVKQGNVVGISGVLADITERKQAEEELQRSEMQYRSLTENSPDLIARFDRQYRHLYVNPTAAKAGRYSPHEYVGKTIAETGVPEEGARKWEERIRTVFETGQIVDVEDSFETSNGLQNFHTKLVPEFARDGSIHSVQSIARDITERKQAEEALAESERKLKTLFEILPVGTSILNAQRKIVYVNPALERILDISRESLFKGDYRSRAYLRPDGTLMPAEEFASVRAIKEQRAVHNVEIGVVKEDGTVIWTTVSAVPLGFSDWEVLVVTSDITERKRAEEALRASEERYRRLFEGDLAGDYVSTPAGKLIACNAAFARIFRFKSIDDALATNTHELYPNPEARQLFLRSLRQNRRLELREAWLKRRDGTDLHVIENSFSVFDDKGELIEIRGYLLDDTERKLAEKALRESEERFRELFNRMSSGVAVYEAIDSGGDFIFRDFNPAAERIEKVSRKDILGKRVTEAFPGVKAFGVFEVFQRVWQTGKPEYLPENIYKDERDPGSWRESSVFKLPTGEIVAIYNDITERKQAAEALQKSEERYRSLFANMLDGFAYCKMIYDDHNRPVDFVYLDVNSAFERLTGLKDVEGKRVSEVLPDVKESSPELLERYGRVALTGKPEQFEFSLKSLNQMLSISVYSTEKGYFVAVFENITQRKRAEERRITSQEQLRQLAGHLQSVREEERKHLSQEFHDQLGQTLTALKMDSALLQRELADKAREVSRSTLGEKIQTMQGLIDTGIQAIRGIMSELRPELLDQLGLVAALEWEAERFQKRSGLKCQFTSELGEFQFDPKKSIALFRIFQEAVTNVARHAQATTVEVSVRREKNDVLLEIKDNGIGIEPNAEHKARSFGLVGMRERAVLLGGTLEITGIKGRGTTILVRMPFEQTLPDGGAAL